MRGEKIMEWPRTTPERGSPPHARGKGLILAHFLITFRITPACAGKRSTIFVAVDQPKDHPRMRREKLPALPGRDGEKGSPPHAQGKVSA